MFLINGLKGIAFIVIQISQIDLAIIKVITGEIASIITIRILNNNNNNNR
jgi:hypothetical protein